jgi:hypothetical protein
MTLWEIMVGYPGSQDIDQHPYYPYRLAKLAWHIYHHSFTKNGRWFLAGTAIANLSFTMFWSFDIQTWILATAINCIWIPDFVAKMIPLNDTATLGGNVTIQIGQEVTLSPSSVSLSANSMVHFERLPLALVASHDEGFSVNENNSLQLGLRGRFRGRWVVPAIRISRPGPFGIVSASRVIPANVQICVLPSLPESQSVLTAKAVLTEMHSARASGNRTMSSGMDVIRAHTPGDPSNRIDWRASSRAAATSKPALQVRVAQRSAVDGVVIVVDERVVIADVSKWQHWSGRGIREPLPIPEFESLISLAYACALSLLRDGQTIACITSQRQRITQLRSPDEIAEAFASISHFETPSTMLAEVPAPLVPDEDALLFTLVPEEFSSQDEEVRGRHVCVIADVNGFAGGTVENA